MTETCLDIARRIAKGRLTEQEILDAFEREQKIRERILASGKTTNLDQRVANAIIREATNAKISAALRRKAAALNIQAREKIDAHIQSLKAQGLTPRRAILATIEGTQHGVSGGRASVARQALAYEALYKGDMMARVQREKPHIIDLLRNKEFDSAVTKELYELREGGSPGKTGNQDAQYLAKVLGSGLEESRTDLNKFGAMISKLDGYAGPQVHDDIAMLKGGADKWISTIRPLLDLERTFSDLTDPKEIDDALTGAYQTIVSGISSKPSAALRGQRVGPANLANRLGQHRVLHFSDAEAALQYRDLYGRGSTIQLILAHQTNAARTAAAMEAFGPNPEVMIDSIIAREAINLKKQLGAGGKTDKKILKQIDELKPENFQTPIDIMIGVSNVPVNINQATLHNNIRSGINIAKLGGATITSVPSDTATAASAAMFRGQGFWNGLFKTIGAMFEQVSSKQAKEIAYLFGEGFDGISGHIANAAVANDGVPGAIAEASHTFFKWSGLSGWTDTARAAAARITAAHIGQNLGKTFTKLDPRLQHVLQLNGINETKWSVLRQAGYREVNGNKYLTPDRVRLLTDEQVAPLVNNRTSADTARRSLEMDLRGYVADETNYGVIETDAASRRYTTAGYRPGTIAGEAIRYLMQFKGFPIAFANRILGRAFEGGPGRNMAERILNNKAHIGALIAGTTIAGYMAMIMKDAVRGIWPPRDPFSWKTWSAAMVQGGGLGIYGDYLFGQASRYGQSAIITGLGPAAGTVSDIYDLYSQAINGDSKASQALNLIINNTPYANLFYVKPALDILFLNSLRESASPGYLRRQEQFRKRDYNQTYVLPRTVHDLTH